MSINRVPFVDLGRQYQSVGEEIIKKFEGIMKSGMFVLGDELKAFEKQVAELCQTRFAIGVANGTDAIVLALRALGVGAGDEVITAPNSFIATAGAINMVGADIKFVDVQADLNIDPQKIEAAITEKTKAIIAIHLTGRPAAMDKINKIAKAHNLFVIEDAAQAIGAKLNDVPVGALGDVATFSLHPLKNLNVYGDGGFITTNSEEIYRHICMDRNHGLVDRDNSLKWGLNSRLDEIHAAAANIKLKHFDEWTARFREIADKYVSGLKDIAQVEVPIDKPNEFGVYHNFVIYAEKRDELMQFLENEYNVQTKIHYPVLLHLQPAAEALGYVKGDFPVAERLADKMMSLPIFPELTDEEVTYVISAIQKFYQ
jgi:dTDP-4-amino-4,6-dideoxygalactose transaminase